MRRFARASVVVALLCAAVSGCGDQTEPPVAVGDGPVARSTIPAGPTETPGTMPSSFSSPTPADPTQVEPTQVASPADVQESPTPDASPTVISTDEVFATPETLDGYRALSTGINNLFRRAQQVEKQNPDADPQTADDVKKLLGDVFPPGVDLAEFNSGGQMCLSGPTDTFLTLDQQGEGLRQSFGTGSCDHADEDGDLIVDITFTFDHLDDVPKAVFLTTVVKGQNLAARIPDLDGFIEILNAST